ncbi:DUF815 domain-containing protein, partial [Rhizobium hidalgonense]
QVTFYSFNQQEYLNLIQSWLTRFGWSADDIAQQERLALQWATQKGNRSGRVAMQFAKHVAGQRLLQQAQG